MGTKENKRKDKFRKEYGSSDHKRENKDLNEFIEEDE